jgi:hypothetical protein
LRKSQNTGIMVRRQRICPSAIRSERYGEEMTATAERGIAASERAQVPPVPEPGQVVTVRGSTWAVTDVREQGLPRSPADEGTPSLSHVVGLQSLDEDRLGEELLVVWELEVGHTVAPDQGLPRDDRLGRLR